MLRHAYTSRIRIAFVADWLVTYGGAEHVLQELYDLFPDAPLFTTVARKGNLGPLDAKDIRTTSMQPLYRLLGRHEPLLSLLPRAIESIDLSEFDVIISSSHAVAKGVICKPSAVHVCYCHTPMRYAWEMEDRYLRDFGIPEFLKPAIRRRLSALRRWDLSTAKRVDTFIANSTTTQERIKTYYGRESIVLPPPVSEKLFECALANGDRSNSYYLAIGRMVPYKRFDLLIDVANRTKLPLKIAGSGSDQARLKKLAGPTVEFLGRVKDEDLPSLYANARAVLFPQEEDAGIVLLEAHACGTPVIAFSKGGARDALIDGKTGIFFDEQTPEALEEAIKRFEEKRFDGTAIREHAEQFSSERFKKRFMDIVSQSLVKK